MNTDYTIRKALPEDWESAMELVWKVFGEFEAPEYGKEGTENFLKFISDERLNKMFVAGEYKMYVATYENRIVGVIGLRTRNHISLLFVDREFHRRGIARSLVKMAQKDLMKEGIVKLSVNASPYGRPFYKAIGFMETDVEQHADGIIYFPMMCLSEIKDK